MKTSIKTKGKRRSPYGGWTRERRMAAAARCRAHRPSRFSTGPKTRAGRAAVRLNALKHGAYTAHWRDLYRAMCRYKAFIHDIIALQEQNMPPFTLRTRMNWQGCGCLYRSYMLYGCDPDINGLHSRAGPCHDGSDDHVAQILFTSFENLDKSESLFGCEVASFPKQDKIRS